MMMDLSGLISFVPLYVNFQVQYLYATLLTESW